MNTLKKILLVAVLISAGCYTMNAQTTRAEKRLAKQAEIKKLLDNKAFTFVAESVNTTYGGNHQLTSEYDLKITPDTVISYLPFFGRAYIAPIYPEEGGIKFTSVKFNYKVDQRKNGNQDIMIKPTDTKNNEQLFLSVGINGFATLSINSINREAISFFGYIEENKK